MEEIISAARELLNAQSAEVIVIEEVPHLIVPNTCTVQAMPQLLERLAPQRIKRSVLAHDVRGFVDYVNEYKLAGDDHGTSRIYSGPFEAPKLECRLDDHQPDAPSHSTHTAHFNCPTTAEWKTWKGADKKTMNQVTFAEFVEANARDIREPDAASLLALTLNFKDSGNAEFRSAVRLNDGRVQFQFVQKEDAGQVQFPEKLKIGIPVFEGIATGYALTARLRYRIKEGELTLWYELDRPDVVMRAAHEELLAHVQEATQLRVYRAL